MHSVFRVSPGSCNTIQYEQNLTPTMYLCSTLETYLIIMLYTLTAVKGIKIISTSSHIKYN